MIDTVRFRTALLAPVHPPSGWSATRGRCNRLDGDKEGDGTESEYVCLQHGQSGLRLFGSPLEPYRGQEAFVTRKVEVSLPRLLHGTNGRLLKDQRELDESIALVEKLMKGVSFERMGHLCEDRTFTRVDLVWQYEGEISDWIDDLKRARHPQIRKSTVEYQGESIHFPGKDRHLRVYDKSKESQGRRGRVIRAEVQMTGKALRDGFAGTANEVTELDFRRAYRVYRDFLCQFEPVRRPKIGKIVEFLAYCDRYGVLDPVTGRPMFDVWARDKHPRHVRRVRSQMQRAVILWEEFSFRQLLPEDGPPPAVELIA